MPTGHPAGVDLSLWLLLLRSFSPRTTGQSLAQLSCLWPLNTTVLAISPSPQITGPSDPTDLFFHPLGLHLGHMDSSSKPPCLHSTAHCVNLSPLHHVVVVVWLLICVTSLKPQELSPCDSLGKKTRVCCHFLSNGSSQPRDQTCTSCIGRRILYF